MRETLWRDSTFLEDTLKGIAFSGDLSYYDYVRIKNKALDKLKKYI
jgi:hypothetical protein